MSSTDDAPLNSLLTIFNITKKSELIDHCRDVVIDGTDWLPRKPLIYDGEANFVGPLDAPVPGFVEDPDENQHQFAEDRVHHDVSRGAGLRGVDAFPQFPLLIERLETGI